MIKKRARTSEAVESKELEAKIEQFASKAEPVLDESSDEPKKRRLKRELVFRRMTFSLNDTVDDQINDIGSKPTIFTVTRSEVVKSAIMYLHEKTDEQIIEILKRFRHKR